MGRDLQALDDDVQEGREKRSYDLLTHAEIIPVLPNLSSADRRLIRSNKARHAALATVIGAAEDLLAERGEARAAFHSTVVGSNQQDPIEPASELGAQATTPDVQPLHLTEASSAPEPQAGDATTMRRNPKTPAVILAGLGIVAIVVALAVAPSTNPTHVAATKTSPSLASQKGASTMQPALAVTPPPPTSSSPVATVPEPQDATVPDYVAPPLPTSPLTTDVVCPTGTVTVTVGQLQSQQSPSDPTGWDVTISGTLRNASNAPIDMPAVDVTITTSNADEAAYGDSNTSQLAAGQSANWNATSYVSSRTAPTATAQPGRWAWVDSREAGCPSG